jgi:hypothetical protein
MTGTGAGTVVSGGSAATGARVALCPTYGVDGGAVDLPAPAGRPA